MSPYGEARIFALSKGFAPLRPWGLLANLVYFTLQDRLQKETLAIVKFIGETIRLTIGADKEAVPHLQESLARMLHTYYHIPGDYVALRNKIMNLPEYDEGDVMDKLSGWG